MSTPEQPPAEERPAPAEASTGPTVTTAPPRSRWRFSGVPSHVGPARTSTIVLAVLFVGIFVLYLYVHPRAPVTTGSTTGTTGGTGQVQQPAPTRTATPTPTPTRTTAPASTSAPSSAASTSSGTTTRSRTATPTTSSQTTGAPGGTSGSSTALPSLPTSGSAPTS